MPIPDLTTLEEVKPTSKLPDFDSLTPVGQPAAKSLLPPISPVQYADYAPADKLGTILSKIPPEVLAQSEAIKQRGEAQSEKEKEAALSAIPNLARGVATDVVMGNLQPSPTYRQQFKNTIAALNQEPLPQDVTLSEISKQHPVLATVGKIGQGALGTAPMLALGGLPEGAAKLVALGFTGQMIKSGGDAATMLGEEMGKNPEDRDLDKITSAVSDLSQTAVFAPLAAKFGATDAIESRVRPKDFLIRKLAQLLKDSPPIWPAAAAFLTAKTPIQPPSTTGAQNASRIQKAIEVPQLEVRPQVGQETPLRQQPQKPAEESPPQGTPPRQQASGVLKPIAVEYRELANNPNRTPEQEARFQELTALNKSRQTVAPTAPTPVATGQEGVTSVPHSEKPSEILPVRSQTPAPPRPQRNGRDATARDAWDEQYGMMHKGGRTHNDDGTPYQPTVFDEVMVDVQNELSAAKDQDEAALRMAGDYTTFGLGNRIKKMLDAGWKWDSKEKRMVNPNNPTQKASLFGKETAAENPTPPPSPSSKPAQAQEGVKPLTESQFRRQYAQHIDLRSRGGDVAAQREKIISEGFKKGSNVNAMPPSRGGEPNNIVERNFQPKKGDLVLLAPKSAWKHRPNGIEIQNGWKPEPHEAIILDKDNPDMYQEYLKAFNKTKPSAAKPTPPVATGQKPTVKESLTTQVGAKNATTEPRVFYDDNIKKYTATQFHEKWGNMSGTGDTPESAVAALNLHIEAADRHGTWRSVNHPTAKPLSQPKGWQKQTAKPALESKIAIRDITDAQYKKEWFALDKKLRDIDKRISDAIKKGEDDSALVDEEASIRAERDRLERFTNITDEEKPSVVKPTPPVATGQKSLGEKTVLENGLTDQEDKPLPVNDDGTVTLYHRTTPEAKSQISKTGKFQSKENTGEVFFSSKPTGQADAYGNALVTVRVNPKDVRLDDEFPDEIHVAVKKSALGKNNLVQESPPQESARPTEQGKPIWEMTKKEYATQNPMRTIPNSGGKVFYPNLEHKKAVYEAVKNGEGVPVHVLNDYPELVPKIGLKTKLRTPLDTPATATAKVATHIAEVKADEGMRPAKEIKSELVQRLEKAIEDAPSEDVYLSKETVKKQTGTDAKFKPILSDVPLHEVKNDLNRNGIRTYQKQVADALAKHAPKIEINIPGDGNFKIFNTKEALSETLSRAKKIDTRSTVPAKTVSRGTSKEDREWIAEQKSNQTKEQTPAEHIGMGAAVPSEFENNPQTPTGIKNATVDAERQKRGLPAAMKPARRSFGKVWDEAMAKIDQDPTITDRLLDSLRSKPRALTDLEDALLLHRQIELQNDYGKTTRDLAQAYDDAKEFPNRLDDVSELKDRVAGISDRLLDLYDIGKSSGTETGRGLNARKMMANEDYSLAQMEVSKRAANGGKPLTDEQRSQIEELHNQIANLQRAHDDYMAASQERISKLEAQRVIDEIYRTANPPIEPHIRTIAERIMSTIDNQASAAMNRIKARRAEGRLFTGVDPAELADYAIYGAAKIARGTAELSKWSAEMVKDFGDYIKPHLKQIFAAAQKKYEANFDRQSPFSKPKTKRAIRDLPVGEQKTIVQDKIRKRFESGRRDEVTAMVQKLARLFVEEGVKTRDALIDAVHGFLSDIDPEISRRDTMDAISGYGDFKPITKDQISVELRDLKGQMQQVAKLEDMQAGQPPLKTGVERRIPTKEESRLIKLVNEAKRKFQIPITDPNTQLRSSLDELKKRMQTRTDELEQKLKDKDFAARPRPEPVKLDSEGLRVKANLERAKQAFQHGLQLDRLKNRSMLEKIQDTFVRWRRGFLLSSPITLAKLTAAAAQRMTITPLEEAVGSAYSRLLPKVAGKASREGFLNSKAEAKSLTEAVTQGLKDSWDVLRTGQSQLDVLFGKGREGYVGESFVLPRSVVDFFGHVHGALKAPVKRAEFARAFEKRSAQAIKNGVDVSDPMVKTRLMVESFKDANRAIFLQDNRVVSAYRRAMSALEEKNKTTGRVPVSGKAISTIGKVIFPIVRVPTNIIAETFQYALGTVTGSARLALAFRRGIDNLKPEEADLIMRELKKGSIGAAVLLLGYFNPELVGGYYQQGEKRKTGDVAYGSVKLFGITIPSFLLHNPLLETAQIGATIRRVADSKLRKRDAQPQGIPAGLLAGGLGLTEEVPFVNDSLELTKAFNPAERSGYFGELGKSFVVPQLSQFIANQTDKDSSGNVIKRNPTTLWQHIETGLPVLRKNVPVRK